MDTDKSSLLNSIYEELLGINIKLDITNVPTPAYIQSKIVQCNDYQRKVEKHFLNIKRQTTFLEKTFRIKKVEIEIKKRDILTNNSTAKKSPTVKEREAYVDGLLEEDYNELLSAENDLNDYKSLLDSIKLVERNLKSTNSDIKSLVRIMEQQINRLNVGSPDDPDVKELTEGLSDLDSLEAEIDLDDIEKSVEYTTTEKDYVDPTPAEDENKIEIKLSNIVNLDDDVEIDLDGIGDEGIVDNTSELLIETEIEIEDTKPEDEVSIDVEPEAEVSVDVEPEVEEKEEIVEDLDGLPNLDSFLDGGESVEETTEGLSVDDTISIGDEITIEETSEEVIKEPSSDDVILPDATPDASIDVDGIMNDLEVIVEDPSKAEESTEDETGTVDMDLDSITVEEKIAIEDKKEPYGEVKPGSLAEILSEPEKTLDNVKNEKQEEKEEEPKVEDEQTPIGTEDEGIDIDALLDTI